jgi:glycosyltransferase involved in cell wall biosynthesis
MLAIGDRGRASSRFRVWDHVEALEAIAGPARADALVPMALAKRRLALAARLLIRFPLWCYWFLRARRIYIQETLILWPLVALLARPMSKNVVFDFSDPIDTYGQGLRGRLRKYGFASMVRYSTHVIVENRVYQKDLPRSDVHQVYGPVNTARYAEGLVQRPSRCATSPLRIGWTGSPGTLKFIQPLFAPLDRLAEEVNIELVLIGVPQTMYDFVTLPVTCLPWDEEQEFIEVPKFDLGLHALDTSPAALKRGAGKLFIYMAAGVPFITDARGIGADVAMESGVGTLVVDKADWPDRLRAILGDSATREVHSRNGMEYSQAHMSYEAFRSLLFRLMVPEAVCELQDGDNV